MGNSQSKKEEPKPKELKGIFGKELENLNHVINEILNQDNNFKNQNYNFLSETTCSSYFLVFKNELENHLKVDIDTLGTSLYLVPKIDEKKIETKYNVTKEKLCQKISHHYIKILYIICLIKYIFDVENGGNNSIPGIVFSNIQFEKDMMHINYCKTHHENENKSKKIDFGIIQGIAFTTQYFLTEDEATAFMSLMRSILARKNKHNIFQQVCQMSKMKNLTVKEFQEIESTFNEHIDCNKLSNQKGGSEINDIAMAKSGLSIDTRRDSSTKVNLKVEISKNNPFISQDMCPSYISYEYHPASVDITTKEGKVIFNMYKKMKKRYEDNLKAFEETMSFLVEKNKTGYVLRDITKNELDKIIDDVKSRVKLFYIQSIVDFQMLLDEAIAYEKKYPRLSNKPFF